jgi:hypothetical protein
MPPDENDTPPSVLGAENVQENAQLRWLGPHGSTSAHAAEHLTRALGIWQIPTSGSGRLPY